MQSTNPAGPADGDIPAAAFRALLDLLPIAVVLLGRDAHVRLLNAEAAQLLRDRPELHMAGSRIVARRAEEQAEFEAAVAKVFVTGRDTVFAFRTREGVAEFAIDMHPFPAAGGVLAILTPVRSGSHAHAAVLAVTLQLTAAEIRLVERLQSGDSLAAAAETTAISITTARSTLRSVLAKSGSRNQATLAAVLCRLAKLRRRP